MSKYRYREVKNYIHNELKLTKEDIKEIMIPIVKEEVKRIFQNTYGNDADIERWVRCMVSNEIQRHGDYSMTECCMKLRIIQMTMNARYVLFIRNVMN